MKMVKRALLLASSLVFSIAIVEGGLRQLTPFPIHGHMSNRVPHPVLGYTLDPSDRDIDGDGFRNPDGGGPYAIVVIGDSQTQGFNAGAADTWPAQLADRLDVRIYNAGIGGYGIYHYPYLAARAAEKSPSLVLLALYPANDLRKPEGLARDYLAGIRGIDPSLLFTTGMKPVRRSEESLSKTLKSNLAIASIISYAIDRRGAAGAAYYGVGGYAIKKRRIAMHRSFTDLSDAATRTRFLHSQAIIGNIRSDLAEADIAFGVVIIPSKEVVIHEWAKENGVAIPKGVQVGNEQELVEGYIAYFAESGIRHIDATPFVLAAFQQSADLGKVFYPFGDGHPLAEGYGSYASAAAELVRELGVAARR
ncbi:MAG: hypothetical protein IH973_05910 [Myxococcales bacterium]|nr:hypothetical protein [Myxococcales bacterium]